MGKSFLLPQFRGKVQRAKRIAQGAESIAQSAKSLITFTEILFQFFQHQLND